MATLAGKAFAGGVGYEELAHRLEQRIDVALERVLLDQRRLFQIRDAAEDLVLIRRQIDLVVHADRDRLRLVAARDRSGLLRDDLLGVTRVLHLAVEALFLALVEPRPLLG